MAKHRNKAKSDNADWDAAFAAVSRLAGARKVVGLHAEAGNDDLPVDAAHTSEKTPPAADSVSLAQAHEEIEKAAAALESAQPELPAPAHSNQAEPSHADHQHKDGAGKRPRRIPVWFLMTLIWVGVVAVFISAIQAVKILM